MMRIIVTGGLGFIGSAVVRRLLGGTDHEVLNLDLESYAATHGSVASAVEATRTSPVPPAPGADRQVLPSGRYRQLKLDVADGHGVRAAFAEFQPDAVIHLAAESHVDRSIDDPGDFVQSNVVGTYALLEAARDSAVHRGVLDSFRFVHVSTDEVFGTLGTHDAPFDETTPYDPRSPYAASKAASDHLVRAWGTTYGLPTLITNGSNTYGPFQFPEKLIPLMIIKALTGERLPVYGRGEHVRDWVFVDDHARAILMTLDRGQPGETYVIGGEAERTNLSVVEEICDVLDDRVGPHQELGGRGRRSLIAHQPDRPGHDHRYAVDSSKIRRTLGWEPRLTFEEGLAATVEWYLANEWWWRPLIEHRYGGHRLGGAGTP